MKSAEEIENKGDEISSHGDGQGEPTLEQSLKAKYEGTCRRWQESLRDLLAKHREFLELRSRQTEEEKALNPIPPVIFWTARKIAERTADKSSTPERSQ
jgi:hypothetical protein